MEAFSCTLGLVGHKVHLKESKRPSMGIPELEKILGGGTPEGDSVLIAGPFGTGKSALATQFIAEGLRHGQRGIMAIFEARPEEYMNRAGTFGLNLQEACSEGKLETLYLRPLDLSIDETMREFSTLLQG